MSTVKHKRVFLFLINFFVTYLIGIVMYNTYLNKFQQHTTGFVCDPITVSVAEHTRNFINFLGFTSFYTPHVSEYSLNFYVNDVLLVRIIEGCNSVSVIVLFVAFIVAFRTRLLPTLFYLLAGSFLIYGINILRIAFIILIMRKYPSLTDFSHDILFPLIIYGFVFILWVLWVNYFSTSKVKTQ
ncbi:MAG: exosortase family protein XrtF [Flavicella sp.]